MKTDSVSGDDGLVALGVPPQHVSRRGTSGEVARLTVELPAEMRDELEHLADENERSLGGEVRVALRRYLAGIAA